MAAILLLTAAAAGAQTGNVWVLHASNPLFYNSTNEVPANVPPVDEDFPVRIWNDPSVMKEGSTYKMWASLDRTAPPDQPQYWDVSIYYLESSDGYTWTVMNGGNPVFTPGPHCDQPGARFDCRGVETPVVIKVGSTYHLYYTYYSSDSGSPDYNPECPKIGHVSATSETSFDSSTPVSLSSINTPVCSGTIPTNWGFLGRAEPAVYHDGSQFHLYFADIRCRNFACGNDPPPIAQRGISLATSTDGVAFSQVGASPVLLQTSTSYPAAQGWEGYSTPWVLKVGSTWHLFADAFLVLYGGHVQRSLAHYSSTNGTSFAEVAQNIVLSNGQPWNLVEVRAPSIIEDGGSFRMWFAGSTGGFGSALLSPACATFSTSNPSCINGIGHAQLETKPSFTDTGVVLKGGIAAK